MLAVEIVICGNFNIIADWIMKLTPFARRLRSSWMERPVRTEGVFNMASMGKIHWLSWPGILKLYAAAGMLLKEELIARGGYREDRGGGEGTAGGTTYRAGIR